MREEFSEPNSQAYPFSTGLCRGQSHISDKQQEHDTDHQTRGVRVSHLLAQKKETGAQSMLTIILRKNRSVCAEFRVDARKLFFAFVNPAVYRACLSAAQSMASKYTL